MEQLETLLFKNKLNTKSLIELLPLFSQNTLNNIHDDIINLKLQKEKITIFTDGACTNNGRTSARAAYAVYFPDFPDLCISKKLITEPTNQRAELSAILSAIRLIKQNKELFFDKEIVIYTDSMYSVNCITVWSKEWQKNGWKGSNKKPIKNVELISAILDDLKTIDIIIKFEHTFSHTTEPKGDPIKYKIWLGNKIVDQMASDILK